MSHATALRTVVVGSSPEMAGRWADLQDEQPDLSLTFRSTFDAAVEALRESDGSVGVIVRGEVLLDLRFASEVERACHAGDLEGIPWLMLTSDGSSVDGQRFDNGGFLDRAATARFTPPRALAATDPAVAIVSIERLRGVLEPGQVVASPTELVELGWRRGAGSYYSSLVRFSMNSAVKAPPAVDSEFHARPEALSERELHSAVRSLRPDPTLTIAIRTTLGRPHMLRRTMASVRVAADLRPVESVVLVGTVDAAALKAEADALRERHATLDLVEEAVPDGEIPSRSACLVRALEIAKTDYVWFVDDDDVVLPESVEKIKDAVHTRERPLIIGASVVMEEEWSTGDTRPLLMHSRKTKVYEPGNWHTAFTGTNSVPICSLVVPRETALERVRTAGLRHDLGEDFALLLLLLTSPGLAVMTVADSIASISVRAGSDNVVNMNDRSLWLRNLSSFMADFAADPMAGSHVMWALGEAVRDSHNAASAVSTNGAPTSDLEKRVAELEAERDGLEQALATVREFASRAHAASGWKTMVSRAMPRTLRPLAYKAYSALRRST